MLSRFGLQAATSGIGYFAGRYMQGQMGSEGEAPPAQAPPDLNSWPEVYRAEQEASNPVMPPNNQFMGAPIHGAGNLLAPYLPQPVLGGAIEQLTDPSNPSADRNRQIASVMPGGLMSAASFLPGIPGLIARGLAPVATGVGGMFLGAEHVAQQQGATVPRQEGFAPPPNLYDQDQLPAQYRAAGLNSQADVVSVLPNTTQNRTVSNSIASRLIPSTYTPPTSGGGDGSGS